ncbi:MAG: DEAD/DEAH box helicase [Rickettsiales bacterium]|jgi:primosomal protein N' (replication factor Y)|nr:DEAD/DEAH box helicase [Rickettsiales bacterium]
MFQENDIIKILVPDMFGSGFDYRATAPCEIGSFAAVSVSRKPYAGIVIGPGDCGLPIEKIKPVAKHYLCKLPPASVEWIKKMSNWTMMPMGAVLRLMISRPELEIANPLRQKKYFDTGAVALNGEQAAAAAAINLNGFSARLLDGITGSGKTQVYFDAALRAYESGKQVLMMMPEIALTAQFATRFEARFGAKPVIWHSNLTPAKRRDIWHGVLSCEARIVVGTRSALFLPWQDLGLIVVDEEHDGSYKQDEMGTYNARDMAVLLGKLSGFPVVLASATPSFETLRNAELGKYAVSRLTSRYGGAALPSIEVADMRKKTDADRKANLQNAAGGGILKGIGS